MCGGADRYLLWFPDEGRTELLILFFIGSEEVNSGLTLIGLFSAINGYLGYVKTN